MPYPLCFSLASHSSNRRRASVWVSDPLVGSSNTISRRVQHSALAISTSLVAHPKPQSVAPRTVLQVGMFPEESRTSRTRRRLGRTVEPIRRDAFSCPTVTLSSPTDPRPIELLVDHGDARSGRRLVRISGPIGAVVDSSSRLGRVLFPIRPYQGCSFRRPFSPRRPISARASPSSHVGAILSA